MKRSATRNYLPVADDLILRWLDQPEIVSGKNKSNRLRQFPVLGRKVYRTAMQTFIAGAQE
jgi:hypothetical protein